MKKIHGFFNGKKKLFGLLFAILTVGVLIFIPAGDALANTLSQVESTGSPNTGGNKRVNALERLYQRTQKRLEIAGNNLDKAEVFADKLETRFLKMAEAGKDVSGLQIVLTQFRQGIVDAHLKWDQASQFINTHNGFNADGKVTDAVIAKQTLLSTHEAMQQGREIMRNAMQSIRDSIREYRGSNPLDSNNQPG